MLKKSPLKAYLTQYGQACHLPIQYQKKWHYVVIVPVCGESHDCLDSLLQNIKSERFLVIVCVNRPDQHSKSTQWSQENNKLITRLKQTALAVNPLDQGYLLSFESFDVCLLDFNDEPFETNQGVGLARKIAADSALQLIDNQVITSPWIYSTDADVQLPTDYFSAIQNDTDYVAYSLPFKHMTDCNQLAQWQALYDFKLSYYQQAMRHIGSVYNYIPLGSCLVIHADAYAKVRGFPIRSGGEDFYLLNKLAKIGRIGQPEAPIIKIKARLSQRVPFGTGPGLMKIKESKESTHFYHPQIFEEIKAWYQQLDDYFNNRVFPDNKRINDVWSIETVIDKVIKQTKTNNRWQQFVTEWFDAFRILKTVHALETDWPRQSLDDLRHLDLFWEITAGLVVPG